MAWIKHRSILQSKISVWSVCSFESGVTKKPLFFSKWNICDFYEAVFLYIHIPQSLCSCACQPVAFLELLFSYCFLGT